MFTQQLFQQLPTPPPRLIATTLLLLSSFLFSATPQASSHIAAPHTADDFVTKWQMPTPDLTLTFPSFGTYDINWGDGTPTQNANGTISHPYTADGDYKVVVSNTIDRFALNGGEDRVKLIDIQQWGSANWISMQGAFSGAENMTMSATDVPDFATATNMENMFRSAESFNGDISLWDVSSIV